MKLLLYFVFGLLGMSQLWADPNHPSLILSQKDDLFIVTLKNPSDLPLKYVDVLHHYPLYQVPGVSVSVLKEGELVVKGYVDTIQSQNAILPLQETILKPHSIVSSSIYLPTYVVGLCRANNLTPEQLPNCKIKLTLRIYLDGTLNDFVEASSRWFPCSKAFIDEASRH
jgi:hypothetical protein